MEQGVTERLPLGEAEIKRKHAEQMQAHQSRYGKLGELMTDEQRDRLKVDLEYRDSGPKVPKPPAPKAATK